MTAASFLPLAPDERLTDREFVDPTHNQGDLAALEYMRARLIAMLRDAPPAAAEPPNREVPIRYASEPTGQVHRMVILAPQRLIEHPNLAVVGFCGQKRADANAELLQAVDAELLQEFLHHTYVLSYSSIELPDGNWANLVLLDDPTGIEHWRASQRHAYAARELSPQHYQSIRLHNGVLPGGLGAPQIVLTSTKYYAFEPAGWWQAMRMYEPS